MSGEYDEHERRTCPRAGEIGHWGCGVCKHGQLYSDCMPCFIRRTNPGLDARIEHERRLVKAIGDEIGFGRTMQLCEELWNELTPGAAHSVGPCSELMTPCRCVAEQSSVGCDWCCGARRVTHYVRSLQEGKP